MEVADGDFPRMGYNFTLLSSLGSLALHSIFGSIFSKNVCRSLFIIIYCSLECFGYVTDADDMLVPLAAGDTYWSNAKMNITIADENGIRVH